MSADNTEEKIAEKLADLAVGETNTGGNTGEITGNVNENTDNVNENTGNAGAQTAKKKSKKGKKKQKNTESPELLGLPEDITAEDVRKAREQSASCAAVMVHATFAEYLKSIGQPKLAKQVLKDCPLPQSQIRRLAVPVNSELEIIFCLGMVSKDYAPDIQLPPQMFKDDEHKENVKKLIFFTMGQLKTMAVMYFVSWMKVSPLAERIRKICGNIYYDIDENQLGYIRLYSDKQPVNETILIGVLYFFKHNGNIIPIDPRTARNQRNDNQPSNPSATTPSPVNQ